MCVHVVRASYLSVLTPFILFLLCPKRGLALLMVCVDVFVCVCQCCGILSARLCTAAGGRENVCVLGLQGSFRMTDVL